MMKTCTNCTHFGGLALKRVVEVDNGCKEVENEWLCRFGLFTTGSRIRSLEPCGEYNTKQHVVVQVKPVVNGGGSIFNGMFRVRTA